MTEMHKFGLGLLLMLLLCITASASIQYEIIDLGTLDGPWGKAWAVNDIGQIVGAGYTAENIDHAALWTAGQPTIDLGTLGGSTSRAYAINSAGQIVGRAQTDLGLSHAFSWDGQDLIDLGTLGGDHSQAWDINDLGQVVGWADTVEGYYHEEDKLSEYFLLMRALQLVSSSRKQEVCSKDAIERLIQGTSAK